MRIFTPEKYVQFVNVSRKIQAYNINHTEHKKRYTAPLKVRAG